MSIGAIKTYSNLPQIILICVNSFQIRVDSCMLSKPIRPEFLTCYNKMAMSNTNTKKLRREVEILKAQLAGEQKPQERTQPKNEVKQPKKVKKTTEESFDDGYVQKDLKRSLIITAGVLILITALYLSQPYWSTLTSF